MKIDHSNIHEIYLEYKEQLFDRLIHYHDEQDRLIISVERIHSHSANERFDRVIKMFSMFLVLD